LRRRREGSSKKEESYAKKRTNRASHKKRTSLKRQGLNTKGPKETWSRKVTAPRGEGRSPTKIPGTEGLRKKKKKGRRHHLTGTEEGGGESLQWSGMGIAGKRTEGGEAKHGKKSTMAEKMVRRTRPSREDKLTPRNFVLEET